MKRPTILLMIFLATVTYSGSTWADSVYECVGDTGEASFSSRPCRGSLAGFDRARYAAHDQRLEQVKSGIVALKRQLMDLRRQHNYTMSQLPPEEAASLTLDYHQQVASIEAEIKLLQARQTQLVGVSFDDLIQDQD